MRTIVFNSESKAKEYKIISVRTQGIYNAGEVIEIVKTDNINKLLEGKQHEVIGILK